MIDRHNRNRRRAAWGASFRPSESSSVLPNEYPVILHLAPSGVEPSGLGNRTPLHTGLANRRTIHSGPPEHWRSGQESNLRRVLRTMRNTAPTHMPPHVVADVVYCQPKGGVSMDDIRTSSRSIAFVTYFSIASLLNYLCQFWLCWGCFRQILPRNRLHFLKMLPAPRKRRLIL